MVATRVDERPEGSGEPRRGAPVDRVWAALAEVPDPEIPALSVVDLGMVRSVELDGERLRVELLPTFMGCPALDLIRQAVAARLDGMAADVRVEMTFAEPWTSERITAEGRRKLRESGFAPPRSATCPFCGSRDTTLENPFGPTRCRAIFWCNHCRQPFEQFKAI